ncbi:hypothetical protein IFM89_026269 [Coptis chinensis]|uniref:Uncharacterized protein n=1 Tax=Coptis chinensis TaxID=261450 RepID=A0A835M1S2_9MAGN|nr:hypothetical protein IFM89_026269 [Coptis chinensis]
MTGRMLITTRAENAPSDFFRILRDGNAYKLNYCPTDVCPICRFRCGDIGVSTENRIRLLAFGNLVDIWRDNWLGSASLKDALNLTNHELKDCNSKVSTLIVNGSVQIPSNFQALITTAGLTTDGILKWNDGDRDTLIWCLDLKGKFSVASAFQEIQGKRNVNSWHKHMWNSHTHPRTA